MSFIPLTSSQSLSFADNSYYRNAAREAQWGEPVYYAPGDWPYGTYGGYGGPHYKENYNYNNSPETAKGNCTWWCCGRLRQTIGTTLTGMGDGQNWAANYAASGGTVDSDATNIQPGDIICLKDSKDGHVMFVEKVEGDTITISQSAWSTRSVWNNMACLVTTFNRNDLYARNSINMYKDLDQTAAYEEVVGILRTGEDAPSVETLAGTVTPSGYNVTMSGTESTKDFSFNIIITGIPEDETITGGLTYTGLTVESESAWAYTNYTGVDGETYTRAEKDITLRYTREHTYAYSTTKYLTVSITKSTGSVNISRSMIISVEASETPVIAIVRRLMLRRKRGRCNASIHI